MWLLGSTLRINLCEREVKEIEQGRRRGQVAMNSGSNFGIDSVKSSMDRVNF